MAFVKNHDEQTEHFCRHPGASRGPELYASMVLGTLDPGLRRDDEKLNAALDS
jgi:hypothetical protein